MASRKRGKALKVVLTCFGVAVLGVAGAVAAMASRYVPLVAPGTTVQGIEVGGLTPEEARPKIEAWWEGVAQTTLELRVPGLEAQPAGFTPAKLGYSVDLDKTVADLPLEDFWANSSRRLTGASHEGKNVTPVLVHTQTPDDGFAELAKFVADNAGDKSPANAVLLNGQVVRTPEKSGMELDKGSAEEAVRSAVLDGGQIELPVKKGAARVGDEGSLAKITEVVSTFSTRYNEGNASRSSNIKNAAKRLNGTILMPGETFSFNGTLGQRTTKNGFKLAGVYNNGRHDFDIGGGICQVSSTLYNSILLANLKIARRSCHTFPVPYVPVGRDATVSFPAPDFAFKNSLATPIAISAAAGGGKITFWVLGIKDPGLQVKIQTAGHTSWGRPVKTISDPSLPPGKRVVEEPGGAGHRITTYRVVYRDGVEVEREDLGVSLYNGGVRIVRVGKGAPGKKEDEILGRPIDDESPDGGSEFPETIPPVAPALKPAGPSGNRP